MKMKRPIKVMLVVTQLENGGAQTAALNLQNYLNNAGFNAELIFLYEKNPSAYRHENYITLLGRPPRGPVDYVGIFIRLVKIWRQIKPDFVLARTHYSIAYVTCAKLLALSGKAIAVQANVASYAPRVARFVDVVGGTLGLYQRSITVSQTVADTFSRYPRGYIKRIRVIPNGVSEATEEEKVRARQKMGLPPDCFLVGTAGRLAEQKNHAFLIQLASRIPEVRLAIAGEGPLRPLLEAKIAALGVAERVHLLGAVDYMEMKHFYSALDVFVFPSLHEGRSNAMLEALAHGVPVICSNVPTVSDLLTSSDIVCGFSLPLDLDLWAEKIADLERDPTLRQSFADNAKTVASKNSISDMGRSYVGVLKELSPHLWGNER